MKYSNSIADYAAEKVNKNKNFRFIKICVKSYSCFVNNVVYLI